MHLEIIDNKKVEKIQCNFQNILPERNNVFKFSWDWLLVPIRENTYLRYWVQVTTAIRHKKGSTVQAEAERLFNSDLVAPWLLMKFGKLKSNADRRARNNLPISKLSENYAICYCSSHAKRKQSQKLFHLRTEPKVIENFMHSSALPTSVSTKTKNNNKL